MFLSDRRHGHLLQLELGPDGEGEVWRIDLEFRNCHRNVSSLETQIEITGTFEQSGEQKQ